MLHGRERERGILAALVERATAGSAGVLVVLGEPGVGKSALVHDLVSSQQGPPGVEVARVLRTGGVESESPLPFAALHRLLRPVVNFERLPVPQARALRVAFGLEDGPTVEPFMVGMATLSALTDAAEDGPVVCVVDDAHWLDPASADALLFAARQLDADPVVIVFAARYTGGDAATGAFRPQGLPVLELGGLDEGAARQLLDQRGGELLPGEVADRLVRDSGGNPLALLELPTGLSPAQLYGAAPLPQQVTLTAGVERAFLDRCRRLSDEVQTLLLVAAADDTGRVDTVLAAASQCGVQATAWEEAERSGLLTVTGDVVAVQHPLVRSAVYQAATSFERRHAHRALADALRDGDPDRATWHRAAAADGPDRDLADALHQVGVRAEQRGGYVAAASAFERAAALTVNDPARAARLFAAARNGWAAGQAVRARALSASARELASDGLLRADIDRLRARIEVNVGSASDAHRIFVRAARAVADLDPGRALEMATAAALTRTYGGDSGATLDDVHAHLLTATPSDTPRTRCLRLLLGALTASAEGDWAQAVATLEHAMGAGRQVEDLDVLGNLGNTALNLGDDEGARFFYSTMVSSARESGAGHGGHLRTGTARVRPAARWSVGCAAQLGRRSAHLGAQRRPAHPHRRTAGVADPARRPGWHPRLRPPPRTTRSCGGDPPVGDSDRRGARPDALGQGHASHCRRRRGRGAAPLGGLCGFALGWAMLAVLSVRYTDQPQRWAAAPALFMGLGGLLLVGFGSSVREVLSWVWPPALLVLVIWMIVRVHRQLRSRSRRWLLYPVIAMLALASVGGGYETVRAAADAKAYPMPGQLIDVGGHSLHLSCTGAGSPTVVLEPGGGEMSSNLGWIAPAVARDTRVCVYDRAGRGWSEPADTPQDGRQIATDLHRLRQRGHVPGPYVLAGHSFGGLYVLTFAARYPDEVAGMVLVDSTAPASAAKPGATSPAERGSNDVMGRVSTLVSTSARLGLGRLYSQLAFGSLPPRSRDEVRASGATASNVRSTIDEFVQANTSMEQAATLGDFADKPLVVLTAGSGSDAAWSAAQNDLATLSTNSVHRVIDGATHQTLIANEEDAAATSQAILDVVSSVRSAGPLVR